jgi:hypothetical protein
MKKAIIVGSVLVALLVVASGTVWAVDQKNTGCGLGSMVFEGQNGLMSQTFAATTNGTSGNQTFGITSGTSNCERFKSFAYTEKLNTFVADNMDNLARDIARGNGEYVNTLAVLMDVPEIQRASFRTGLQSHFSAIYTSDKISHLEVVKNIINVATTI